MRGTSFIHRIHTLKPSQMVLMLYCELLTDCLLVNWTYISLKLQQTNRTTDLKTVRSNSDVWTVIYYMYSSAFFALEEEKVWK